MYIFKNTIATDILYAKLLSEFFFHKHIRQYNVHASALFLSSYIADIFNCLSSPCSYSSLSSSKSAFEFTTAGVVSISICTILDPDTGKTRVERTMLVRCSNGACLVP